MDTDNLARMANRIALFFESMPDHHEAVDGVATHIKKFWEPRMRQQLRRLVDDLLDVSRINTGKFTIKMGRVELKAVVNDALEVVRSYIELHGHELVIDLPDRPVFLHGDATRLAQILSNLLNNAAKYTNRGGRVTLSAGVDDKTMDRISRDFRQVMAHMAEAVQRTGDRAGAFGAELNGLNAALQAEDAPALTEHLQHALRSSREMQQSAAALKAQVDASRQEIEHLRADLDRARQEVFMDSLTKVLNRKGLDHQLDQLLEEPLAANDTHGLVMLDIDYFKKINDTHGHLVGDQVLAAIGEVLRRVVTGPSQLVARYGGEEFAILLPHASMQDTLDMAEKVRAMAKAMKLRKRNAQDVVLSVTVSAGAAALRAGESANDWIARADAALYRSKQNGRDQVSLAA